MNWKHNLTPCLICKLFLLDYHHKQSWKILKVSWSANLKLSVAKKGADLEISKLPLEILRLRDYLAASSKVSHDHDDQIIGYRMTEIDLLMENSRNSAIYCNCSMAVFDAQSFCCYNREGLLKLKLIKIYLRSSMWQNRLSNLSLISIEPETAEKIDVDRIIYNFASAKARKVKIW